MSDVPISRLHSESCTIRRKTLIDHTPTIAPQATSRQCRETQAERFGTPPSMTEAGCKIRGRLGQRSLSRGRTATHLADGKVLIAGVPIKIGVSKFLEATMYSKTFFCS